MAIESTRGKPAAPSEADAPSQPIAPSEAAAPSEAHAPSRPTATSDADAAGKPAPSGANAPSEADAYNPGAPTRPRAAATVILLRGGDEALEVLLVKRNPQARFMGGVWVFPGGAVDREEGDDEGAYRAAAVRELREEANIALGDVNALVKLSRWITPAQVKTRFDTHFYLAAMPTGQEPRIDGEECVDLAWLTPARALDAHRAGEIALVFPTIKHLEQLAAHATANELIGYARERERTVEPVLPRVIVEGDSARVLLPGEPGY